MVSQATLEHKQDILVLHGVGGSMEKYKVGVCQRGPKYTDLQQS